MVALRGKRRGAGSGLGGVRFHDDDVRLLTGYSKMLRVFSGFPTALCVLFMALLWRLSGGQNGPRWLAFGTRRAATLAVWARIYFGVRSQRVLFFPYFSPGISGLTAHAQPCFCSLQKSAADCCWASTGGIQLGPVGAHFCANARADGEVATNTRTRVSLGICGNLRHCEDSLGTEGSESRATGTRRHRAGKYEPVTASVMTWKRASSATWRSPSNCVSKARLTSSFGAKPALCGPCRKTALRRPCPALFPENLGLPALVGSVLVRPVEDAREYVFFNSALSTDKRDTSLPVTTRLLACVW